MILELLEYFMTPCSATARAMGFLVSTVQVQARYRRCRHAWAPHLEHTRRTIREAVSLCQSRRKVIVLGSGLLHDIPVKELSQSFEKVVLVDIVHTWQARFASWQYPNVQRISADVTETMEQLCKVAALPGQASAALPRSHPVRFVDDPELDLTLSVNLLSQIPHVPGRYLEGRRDEATVAAFSKHLVEAHLDYLCRLPGHTALITDLSVRHMTLDGGQMEEWSALYGAELPAPESTWEWRLAPSPEAVRGVDISTIVAGYADWKKAGCPIKQSHYGYISPK